MAAYFLDSSIVKRYVTEIGSAWVNGLVDPAGGHHVYLANSSGVEVISAVTRRQRAGSISAADAVRALGQLRTEFSSRYRNVEITPALIFRAMSLAETHGLRGYDAVQLATALEVAGRSGLLGLTVTLVSSHAELNTAAAAEGLTVEDPNAHP